MGLPDQDQTEVFQELMVSPLLVGQVWKEQPRWALDLGPYVKR